MQAQTVGGGPFSTVRYRNFFRVYSQVRDEPLEQESRGEGSRDLCHDAYKVMMAAWHSSIVQSMRYVHLSDDSIQNAMERAGTKLGTGRKSDIRRRK
jgi:hypothetical protein